MRAIIKPPAAGLNENDSTACAALEREAAAILTRDGLDPYCAGLCAALSLHLWAHLERAHQVSADFLVMYRLERCNDSDEELERVISHVMLRYQGNAFDLQGWGADQRWEQRIDDTIAPWNDNAYNDIETVVVDTPEELLALIAPYGMAQHIP